MLCVCAEPCGACVRGPALGCSPCRVSPRDSRVAWTAVLGGAGRRPAHFLRAGGAPRPVFGAARIAVGSAGRRFCASDRPLTGADCSQCVTDHGSALGCGCATDCGRPGSAVKAGFVAGRGGIRPRLGAGGAPPARLARCVGEVERERQGALEWVRPEIGACALQSAAAPAASGLALRAGSVGLGREAGSGRALRLGEAPAVVSGGWGTSLDVCRALPAERLSCGGSLAAAVRPRCPSPGCQDPVRCRAGASPRPASSSRLRTGVLRRAQGGQKPPVEQKGKSSLDLDFQRLPWGCAEKTIELDCLEEVKVPIERGSGPDPRTLRAETDATPRGGRPGALEWVRPEIGACALQSAAAPAASGLGRSGWGAKRGLGARCGWARLPPSSRAAGGRVWTCAGPFLRSASAAAVRWLRPCGPGAPPRGARTPCGVGLAHRLGRRLAAGLELAEGRGRECTLLETDGQTPESECRRLPAVRARGLAGVGGLPVRPEDSAVALKGRPLVPYERIHRGHAPRRSRRACAPSGPRCSVEPAGARRTSSALVTGADCSQCVTDHGSALGCGCATDCGRPGSAVKAGFVAGRGGIRPRLGAGGAPPARLARCVGEVERERQGALEWVRPEIGACALQSAAAPAASGLALRAGSVGLGREAGSGRALRLGEAPAVVSGGWGTSLDVCRALPAERLSCGGSLAAAVRPRCPSPGCQDPVRCRAGASPRPASSSRLRTVRPEDSAVALKGRPLVPYERIHRGHAPRRSRRACAPSGPRCSVEPAGARRTSSALVTGADCSQCVTDHGSALGCGCATDCGRPGSAVKAGFVAGRGGIRPRLGAGGAPPARLARCVGEVERERQGALEWVRPEIGACALQSAAAPAASGLGRSGWGAKRGLGARCGWARLPPSSRAAGGRVWTCAGPFLRSASAAAVRWLRPCGPGAPPRGARTPCGVGLAHRLGRRLAAGLELAEGRGRECTLLETDGQTPESECRRLPAVRARGLAGVGGLPVRPEDSAVALKGRPLVPYERIHRGHAPRRSRRACAPSGPRCSVEPAGARRTSSALVTGADCSQCVTDHGSALGCGCATDCGRPGSAVKAGFVAGRGGIRPRLGAGGAPPARLARCVGEVERERQGALEWVRPEIGACALQSAAAPAASGLGRSGWGAKRGLGARCGWARLPPSSRAAGGRVWTCAGPFLRSASAAAVRWLRPCGPGAPPRGARTPCGVGLAHRLGRRLAAGLELAEGRGRECTLLETDGQTPESECRRLPAVRARGLAGVGGLPVRPEDSAVALKGRPLVPYERIHRGHAPRRSRRACAPSGPRCSVEPAGARRTSSALVTGADCSQCVTDHGSALGCGCATDCGRPGSAVKAGFVAGRGGIRPRLGAGGAPPARLARCVGEVERERQGALEWVRPEIGACALQSAAAPAASGLQGEQPLACWSNVGKGSRQAGSITSGQGLALRAGSVGLGREAGSGRALRLGEAPAVVSGGWGTSLDVCRALPAERLSCGGSLAAAVRPRCPSPGCQDPVRCRAGASPRPASSSRLRTGADQGNPTV
ncbi:unnamed protein product [Lampetra planeri]